MEAAPEAVSWALEATPEALLRLLDELILIFCRYGPFHISTDPMALSREREPPPP